MAVATPLGEQSSSTDLQIDLASLEALAGLEMPLLEGVAHHVACVDGLGIHYAEAGKGDPIVLVHGWPQHWWSWRHVMASLAESRRVICPDVRGLGWSQGGRNYSLARLAGDIVGLLDELEIERACLVGHDWGNVAGYQAVLTWPERFTQYVGMGGIHPWAAQGSALRVWLRPWHIYLLALIGQPGVRRLGVAEYCLRTWRYAGEFTAKEMRIYSQAVRRRVSADASRRFDLNVVLHEISHFVRHSRLMHLRVPTLHLNGAEDPLTKGVSHSYREYSDEMRLEEVPACGHFLAEERPDHVIERLTQFLQ